MWKFIKSWTAYVTCVVTASACVTVRVTCPARAYTAFVTWYLILSRLQKKWFTRARKLKVWQQKLLSRILWEAITTTKKRLSPLRIPAMVSCCWLHQNVNYNSLEKYLRLTCTQPLNLNRTTNAGIREEVEEPQQNWWWWLLFSCQIFDFERKFETFILQASAFQTRRYSRFQYLERRW